MIRDINETATFSTGKFGFYLTAPSSGLDIIPRQISNKLEGQAVEGINIPGARSTLCRSGDTDAKVAGDTRAFRTGVSLVG